MKKQAKKQVRFYLLRHGRNLKELGATLPAPEIARAEKVGQSIEDNFTKVVYSPLARAIQTAFAVIKGQGLTPTLLPAIPAFGNQAMFDDLTKPSQFHAIASVKGNYLTLYDVHPAEKVDGVRGDMVTEFDKLFHQCENHDVVLASIHSPSVEMIVDGLLRRQGGQSPESLFLVSELEAVVIDAFQPAPDAGITIHVIGEKIIPPTAR